MNRHDRVKELIGNDNFTKLQASKIIILGVGGVGGYALDCLYRSGLDKNNITIIDYDRFDITNQNRQIGSELPSSQDRLKTEVLNELYPRITTINQKLDIEYIQNFDFEPYDIIIDAIDDINPKIALILKHHKKIISSVGSAKRLDPSYIKYIDIWKTTNDPFAKKLRYELKKQNFTKKFKVVFSDELPLTKEMGSFVGVTGSFGLKICSLVMQKLIDNTK
jgi:tRNA A37 threonylcarbamoyladenosine dehydratase